MSNQSGIKMIKDKGVKFASCEDVKKILLKAGWKVAELEGEVKEKPKK